MAGYVCMCTLFWLAMQGVRAVGVLGLWDGGTGGTVGLWDCGLVGRWDFGD